MTVTLDSHHRFHIAHACFWKGDVQPFTIISNSSIKKGGFTPVNATCLEWVLRYTEELEKSGKFCLCIWPEHCLIGSEGHNVNPVINSGLTTWLEYNNSSSNNLDPNDNGINWIMKGSNKMTEMFSCMKAEVIIPNDKTTHFNQSLMDRFLSREGKLVVVGQASSHCVNFSVRDIVNYWLENSEKNISDLIVLRDCMSPVPGFESAADEFFRDMEKFGVTVCTSEEYCVGWE